MDSYDVVIIGSGFGGSVSALRLTEKGYRVAVVEAGRRWAKEDFPKTNWQTKKFLWAPKLGMRGIQRITLLKDVLVLSGAGVGGGSLVYANTLYRPLDAFYMDVQWSHITDWRAELDAHYDQASRMLGVNEFNDDTPADEVMRKVADRMGVGGTFHYTPVGVYLGPAGQRVPDPYFGGRGPERVGCTQCGSCMVGCRVGAKNTLDRNYLYLAEQDGATVIPDHEVTDVVPNPAGGYDLVASDPRRRRGDVPLHLHADQVIFSAGVLGTLRLLTKLRDEGRLPAVSERLGDVVRTNSEAILGAVAGNYDHDYTKGVAITSSFHPDDHTHIEPVRYPKGSNAMGLLTTLLVDGGGAIPRQLRFLLQIMRHPLAFLKSLSVYRWSEKGVILLVMQSSNNSLRVRRRRGRLTTELGHGEPNPTYLPVANEAARHAADIMDGVAYGSIFEALLDVPTTAHIIGGCCIGDSIETGVTDPYHRLYGYEGLHVADGSVVSANLGVNPSLTIAAMTERAMSMWPNKGEPDPRPIMGEPYRVISPIRPNQPAVPVGAPAELR